MFKIFRAFLFILFLVSTTTVVYSETSWITKKSDKTKAELKKEKKDKKENKKKWIAKKKEKKSKNKKKLKEKIKESQSWITKKSKDKLNEIKKNLKKHRNIDNLPKAELYFTAKIYPSEDEEALYLYGYINSDKKSDKSKKFKFNNTSYYSLNDGIVYFDDGKTSCQADMQKGVLFEDLKGKIIITCKNKKVIGASIEFAKNGKSGEGDGEYKNGSKVGFEFFTKKNEAIAKLKLFKEDNIGGTLLTRRLPAEPDNKNIKLEPHGKYYALLIGNSKYDYNKSWKNLVSPKNDIKKIKEVLDKSYKFEKIITVIDGTKKEIINGFIELSKLSKDNDYVLIYYAGHGDIKYEQAYWIPKDGTEWINQDWIDVNWLDAFIREKIKAHHLAVLVDSCYVGSKFKGLNLIDNMSEEDLKKNYKKQLDNDLNLRARSVLSSGSVGPVSDTVAGTGNSLFALTLINFLKAYDKSSIPVNLKNVAWNMDQYFAGTKQKPHYYNPPTWADGGGDFIFIPKSNIQ